MTRLLLIFLTLPLTLQAQLTIRPTAGPNILDGDPPHLLVTGLQPGQPATVHALRLADAYSPTPSAPTSVLAHAQATFFADPTGRIDLDTAAPIRGTYLSPDPQGLLWSGTRLPLEGDPTQPFTRNLHLQPNDILLHIEVPSSQSADTTIHLTDAAETLDLQPVALPHLNGFFARPKANPKANPTPTIILLHGSEGGNPASARAALRL